MENLVKNYHDQMSRMHPIEKCAKFHLLFESIHPFIDGNGRTGRLIMNLELMKDGYLPIDVKFSDRSKYIDAFKIWNDEKNPNPMVELVTGYVIDSLEKRIELLELSQKQDENIHKFEME